MKHFISIYRQQGGCDYTIGCGIAVHRFDAEDLDAAKQHIIDHADHYGGCDITQVEIIECVSLQTTTMMPGTWVDAIAAKRNAADAAAIDRRDREEYERLKRKYQ